MSAPLLGHGTYPGGKLLLHEALEHPRQRPVTATHHNAARLARIRDRARQKLVQELHAMRQSSLIQPTKIRSALERNAESELIHPCLHNL